MMRYTTVESLPESLRDILPAPVQNQFLVAYNKAWQEYAPPGEERGNISRNEFAVNAGWTAVEEQNGLAGKEWEIKAKARLGPPGQWSR